VPKSLGIKNPV